MTAQYQHTIVMVSDETVGRVDLNSERQTDAALTSHWVRTDEWSLGEAVGVALHRGGQPGNQIWVLTDELWTGQVTLDNKIAKAIPADQLEQSLALEAELDSGISPFESRLAYVSVSPNEMSPTASGRRSWWATQAEQSQLEEVQTAVARSTGTLAGLASLTNTLTSRDETLSFEIDAPDSYEGFARNWLALALSTPGKIPVIGSPQHATLSPWYLRHAWLCTVVILAACLTLHLEGNHRLGLAATQLSQLTDKEKELRRELDSATAAARRFNEVNQKNQAIHDAQFQRHSELRRQQARWTRNRRRPTQLLNALSATAAPEHWIQEIRLNDQYARLLGLSIDSKAIVKLCKDMEAEMDLSSWSVQPAEMSIVPGSNLIRFELTLFPTEGIDDPTVAMLPKRGIDVP